MIKPFEDEEAKKLGLDVLEDDALKVNGKTREELKTAPDIKMVWKQFVEYVSNFNYTGKKWDSPIPVGFNNNGFDDIIINRICGSDPWNLGPVDPDRGTQNFFHPATNVDIMKLIYPWFESNYDIKSISMDNLRDYFGMSRENSHQALQDVKDEAVIFIRLMNLIRKFSTKVVFKDSFK